MENNQTTLDEQIVKHQSECSHSFNLDDECEYCGMPEADYDELSMNDDIQRGVYQ